MPKKGQKITEETRLKMSVAQKKRFFQNPLIGKNNPFYGKHHSEETKMKISLANSGKPAPNHGIKHSTEAINKMREAWENRKERIGNNGIHPETRKIWSANRVGSGNPFYGKSHSPETRQAIAGANRRRKGKWKRPPMSKETRRKMSESKRGEKHPKWKGGKSRDFQYGLEWRKIARRIRQRDGYKCMIDIMHPFGKRRGVPSVHHIEPAYELIKNGFYPHNDDNLICLCQICHNWAESYLEESIPLLKTLLSDCYALTTSHENTHPM